MPTDLLNGQLGNILNIIAAAGALGTAAYGLVDAFKAFGGGVSNAGFSYIRKALTPFLAGHGISFAFGSADVFATLRANWLNGVSKADQKAIAKSLIRLSLTPEGAGQLAKASGVDAQSLKACAERIRDGGILLPQDINILGRFDAVVSAVLDEGYERADQQYRNTSKIAAGTVAIALAVVAGGIIFVTGAAAQSLGKYLGSTDLLIAILIGAVSTPLAPIAKDLSSSLAAAVKAVSAVKR
jgi:hypothetical protein